MSENTLTSNIAEIIAAWKKKPMLMTDALVKGFTEGLHQFKNDRMIKEQLSGRKSADYGLNVGTGNARNSIDVKVSNSGIDTFGVIQIAKRAWYLKVHQHFEFDGHVYPREKEYLMFRSKGNDRKFTRTKHVFIPKRLYFPEEFVTYGRKMLEAHINHRIREVANAE